MIPVRLKLSNFTSYSENTPELDFSKFQMAAISGQNGVGKSSLLDAITWTLWGTSRAGDSADQLIRLGQNQMYVEFEFQLDGHNYIVKRQRKLNSSTNLEFWSSSHNLTEGTIKVTQQKIIDTLRLTYDTFVNSAYIRQGHADEFTTKGASDRKKILADILGLSQYDQLEEKAKEKAKDIQTKLQLLEYQLLEIEVELSQKDQRQQILSQKEQAAEETEKKLREVERQIRVIDSERENLNTKQKALKERKERIQKAQIELEDLKNQIALKQKAQQEFQDILSQKEEIDTNCKMLAQLNEKKRELETKRSELIKVKDAWALDLKILNERRAKRDQEVARLQVQIKELQTQSDQKSEQNDQLSKRKDICPTCGQVIGEEKNKEIIEINNKFIQENQIKIEDLTNKCKKYEDFVFPEEDQAKQKEQTVKKIEEETKQYSEVTQEITAIQKYEHLNIKLQQAEAAIKTHHEALSDLQKIIQTREDQINQELESIKDLTDYQSQLEEIAQKLKQEEMAKEETSQALLQLKGEVGAAKQLMDRATQIEEVFQKRSVEKIELKRQKELYEELALAFGKKGIQAMIIETAIPEIEQETNALLERLTDGRMRISLETQRETKTKVAGGEKGLVETLDIIISDEMGERAYELYSGGEAFRVNFALRLALSKLLTNRAGSKLQFLIVDEGFGTQDAQGRSRIVETLSLIKEDFEKILIITHLDELKEEFDTRIEVSKGAAGSTFEVVGV